MIKNDTGSFRDPAGSIFHYDNKVYRSINTVVQSDFRYVHQSGFLQELISSETLVNYSIVDDEKLKLLVPNASTILQLETLDFISYPYEWSFSMLQKAALLQLDIHIKALDHNITVIDASAFNIQFKGSNPIFIDHLSFRPYKEGDIWWGYKQFCHEFLNPLLLQAYCGIDFQSWFKGSLSGISISEINQLLPLHTKFNWHIFFNIVLQAKLQKKSSKGAAKKTKSVQLPKSALINLLNSIRTWVQKLKPKYDSHFEWSNYASLRLYSKEALTEKRSFITDFCKTNKLNHLWDFGCNQGEFAELALKNSVSTVIGLDVDPQTVDQAFKFSQRQKLNFLPLVMDLANPSANIGWNEAERKGLLERNNSDGLLALALIHHLRIDGNIPLEQIVHFFLQFSPKGVIEFIEKTDPKVQLLLQYRDDIFDDYTLENFVNLIEANSKIIKKIKLPETHRWLFWYEVQ